MSDRKSRRRLELDTSPDIASDPRKSPVGAWRSCHGSLDQLRRKRGWQGTDKRNRSNDLDHICLRSEDIRPIHLSYGRNVQVDSRAFLVRRGAVLALLHPSPSTGRPTRILMRQWNRRAWRAAQGYTRPRAKRRSAAGQHRRTSAGLRGGHRTETPT